MILEEEIIDKKWSPKGSRGTMLSVLFRVDVYICLLLESARDRERERERERECPLSCWLVYLAASKEEAKRGRGSNAQPFMLLGGGDPGRMASVILIRQNIQIRAPTAKTIPALNNNLKFFLSATLTHLKKFF